MRKFLLLCVSVLYISLVQKVKAQNWDTSIFSQPIQMDEVVVSAARSGWDVQGFINRVKNDTTFYKAFKTLRILSHSIDNDIVMLNKEKQTQASYKSNTHQKVIQGCRTMSTANEKVSGNFYDRSGDYNYLTAELYANLFFTKGKVCGENDIVAQNSSREKGRLGKYKAQLKQLIFNPGSSVSGVPLVGNKVAIFEPDVARMYQFKLLSVEYEGEDCYLFQAFPKKEYASDVVYNELSTWFRKSDYSIVARNYSLSYNTLAFTFDVVMKVRLQMAQGRLVPATVSYQGQWWAFTKGKERAKFLAKFSY